MAQQPVSNDPQIWGLLEATMDQQAIIKTAARCGLAYGITALLTPGAAHKLSDLRSDPESRFQMRVIGCHTSVVCGLALAASDEERARMLPAMVAMNAVDALVAGIGGLNGLAKRPALTGVLSLGSWAALMAYALKLRQPALVANHA
jgi:hypothetical protein